MDDTLISNPATAKNEQSDNAQLKWPEIQWIHAEFNSRKNVIEIKIAELEHHPYMASPCVHIGEILDKGSFGAVKVNKGIYKSRDKKQEVAIKEHAKEHMATNEQKCFQVLGKHSNIVKLEALLQSEDRRWLVLEYCDEGNLEQFVLRRNPEINEQLRLIEQSAGAVEYLHCRPTPVIHCDIKPQNILIKTVNDTPVVKLADFSKARVMNSSNDVFTEETGTWLYKAPELIEKKPFSCKIDVFSLGLVYYSFVVYQESDGELTPTVSAVPLEKHLNPFAVGLPLGHQLSFAQEPGCPLPQPDVAPIYDDDSLEIRKIKTLVQKMTVYDPQSRLSIVDVLEELKDLRKQKDEVDATMAQEARSVNLCTQEFLALKIQDEHVYRPFSGTHNKRGYALIFNITKHRTGSDKDEKLMKTLFTELNYSCSVERDKTKQFMIDKLNKISKQENLRHHDSVIVAVMAHGQAHQFFDVDGKPVDYGQIFEPFSNENCPWLSGKPKLYFIQACRGTGSMVFREEPDGTFHSKTLVHSRESDYFLSYATVHGYKALRSTDQSRSSRYVEAMWNVFTNHANKLHISELMTRVNHFMHQPENIPSQAAMFDPTTSKTELKIEQQCAEYTSTLLKDFYFFPRDLTQHTISDIKGVPENTQDTARLLDFQSEAEPINDGLSDEETETSATCSDADLSDDESIPGMLPGNRLLDFETLHGHIDDGLSDIEPEVPIDFYPSLD